jgi:hypothetical protein
MVLFLTFSAENSIEKQSPLSEFGFFAAHPPLPPKPLLYLAISGNT